MVEELLAQAVEEISVVAAKKYSREKPRQIKRPEWVTSGGGSADASSPPQVNRNAYGRAIDRIFAFGSHRPGGDQE